MFPIIEMIFHMKKLKENILIILQNTPISKYKAIIKLVNN